MSLSKVRLKNLSCPFLLSFSNAFPRYLWLRVFRLASKYVNSFLPSFGRLWKGLIFSLAMLSRCMVRFLSETTVHDRLVICLFGGFDCSNIE